MNTYPRLVSLAALSIGAAFPVIAQTTYEWNDPATGGNWSDFFMWETVSGPGSTFPGTGDSALIGNATANRTVIYDSAAAGSLGSLSLTQTSAFTNTLSVQKALTISSPLTLGATGGGSSVLVVQPTGTSPLTLTVPSLTLNSGGTLRLSSGTSNAASPTLSGNVTVNSGGTLDIQRGPVNSGTYFATIDGSLTVASGGLLSFSAGAATDNRINVNGNMSADFGANSGSYLSGRTWILLGATNTIRGTTASTSGTLALQAAGIDQSLAVDSFLAPILALRSVGDSVKTVGGVDGASIVIGSLQFGQGTAGATTTLRLSSNLTARTFGAMPTLTGAGNVHGGRYAIDVNGNTLDLTNQMGPSGDPTLTAAGSGGNNSAHWSYTNSASTEGKIRAGAFNLAGTNLANSSVGANVTLEATATGTALANNLGGPAGTIDPSSRFRYVGTSNAATITSNRNIGAFSVASGTIRIINASLTAAGDVTIGDTTSAGTLDLGGQQLVLTGAANLSGLGTIADSVGGGSVSFASGSTGGLAVGNSGVGTLTFSGNLSGGLNLTNAAISTFDIAGSSSFDSVAMGSRSVVLGGVLHLNFLDGYAPSEGSTYALFTTSGSISGGFTSITSNVGGFGYAFDNGTGLLSVTAIPEPSSWALLFGGVAGAVALRRRRRGV